MLLTQLLICGFDSQAGHSGSPRSQCWEQPLLCPGWLCPAPSAALQLMQSPELAPGACAALQRLLEPGEMCHSNITGMQGAAPGLGQQLCGAGAAAAQEAAACPCGGQKPPGLGQAGSPGAQGRG